MEISTAVSSLAALAHESRLAIYRLLVQAGPTGLAVSEIGAALKIAPATLSFHLKELANAGLTGARQEGRFIYYSASYERMAQLLDYLTENCCSSDGTACSPGACAPARSRGKPAVAPSPRKRKEPK